VPAIHELLRPTSPSAARHGRGTFMIRQGFGCPGDENPDGSWSAARPARAAALVPGNTAGWPIRMTSRRVAVLAWSPISDPGCNPPAPEIRRDRADGPIGVRRGQL